MEKQECCMVIHAWVNCLLWNIWVFFENYSPECKNKWVVLNQGGKLYNNPTIKNLFCKYGYEILPTSPDDSYQNGPMERAYHTIFQVIKALLIGSVLGVKFWPYAFMHVICILNAFSG